MAFLWRYILKLETKVCEYVEFISLFYHDLANDTQLFPVLQQVSKLYAVLHVAS